jgi:phage terminase large subunit GpA-like protein
MKAPLPSLAFLQAEADALKATAAHREFEQIQAATCKAHELFADGKALRAAWNKGLAELPKRLYEVIAAEPGANETRIHYLLSDCAHDWLKEMGDAAKEACWRVPRMGERANDGVKPRGLLTVSQWADNYRELKTGSNLPGRWNTDRTPYLREIMDSLSEHSPVSEVWFMKSVQVGATECLFNWIGYIMHHLKNKDMMAVMPSLELRDRSFNSRLGRMFDETPVLKELVKDASRNKANRDDLLEYGIGARLIKSGANSSKSLRSDPVAYVICDEVDEFPVEIPGSGDPMTLIEGRQTTFSRAKSFFVSTPKIAGESRIEQGYLRSDRRRYLVPCPHCGEYQHLEWSGLKYNTLQIEEEGIKEHERITHVRHAWYECAHCHERIEEAAKTEMLARGYWKAQRPGITSRRGYHINALYAPVGLGKGWRWLAEKWLEVQNDTAELQAFVNERLGESWKERGEHLEAARLISRLEVYPEHLPVRVRTIGADVQKDRIEFTVVDWGEKEEAWVHDHIILPGDPTQQGIWDDLRALVDELAPDCVAIDAGYLTDHVKAFCGQSKFIWPIKGMAGPYRDLVPSEKDRAKRLRQRRKTRPVEIIGVDAAKALIYAHCKIEHPGPGYIHFPQTPAFDDEYFAQLAAEVLVTKVRNHRSYSEWTQIRPRNEALDCIVYALAALRLLGTDLNTPVEGTRGGSLLSGWKRG